MRLSKPQTSEGVKKSSSPQRGGIFVESDSRAIRTPAGCYIPPFQSANLFQGRSFLLIQRNIAPRWGADAATRVSTNMPPRWGGKDFFTSSGSLWYCSDAKELNSGLSSCLKLNDHKLKFVVLLRCAKNWSQAYPH